VSQTAETLLGGSGIANDIKQIAYYNNIFFFLYFTLIVNKYVSVEITILQAATPYIFYVSSSNDYGSSRSSNVFCNTTTGTYL
jgi:hypothetical protein